MKPEYDEAAEILNKGVDVSLRPVFCFVFFRHRQLCRASLTAHNNHHNPFSCPECCWLVWLACCGHQPAFSLFLISGLCWYPFLFATLSSVVNKHPPFRGRAHKTPAWWPQKRSHPQTSPWLGAWTFSLWLSAQDWRSMGKAELLSKMDWLEVLSWAYYIIFTLLYAQREFLCKGWPWLFGK